MNRKQLIGGIAIAVAFLCMNTVAVAQRGGGGGGDKMRFLGNPEVQKEIELLDEQKSDIEEFQSEARDVYRGAFSGMREKMEGLSGEEREALMSEIRDDINEKMEGINKKIEDVLVPHQVERLEQIVLQSQMRRGGTASLVDNDAFRKKVNLTDEEVEKLKKKQEEVSKKVEEKIKKIREEAQDEILSVLPSEKQEKIKSMIGDTFEMQERGRRGGRGGGGFGGRRGGGGGGPGGGRGGGGRRGGGDRPGGGF